MPSPQTKPTKFGVAGFLRWIKEHTILSVIAAIIVTVIPTGLFYVTLPPKLKVDPVDLPEPARPFDWQIDVENTSAFFDITDYHGILVLHSTNSFAADNGSGINFTDSAIGGLGWDGKVIRAGEKVSLPLDQGIKLYLVNAKCADIRLSFRYTWCLGVFSKEVNQCFRLKLFEGGRARWNKLDCSEFGLPGR